MLKRTPKNHSFYTLLPSSNAESKEKSPALSAETFADQNELLKVWNELAIAHAKNKGNPEVQAKILEQINLARPFVEKIQKKMPARLSRTKKDTESSPSPKSFIDAINSITVMGNSIITAIKDHKPGSSEHIKLTEQLARIKKILQEYQPDVDKITAELPDELPEVPVPGCRHI